MRIAPLLVFLVGCVGNEPGGLWPHVGQMCYNIEPEMYNYVPDIDDRLADAAALWGEKAVVSPDCPSRIIVTRLDNEIRLAEEFHVPGYGRVASLIQFSREYLTDGSLVLSKADCIPGRSRLFDAVLVHELGHAFDLRHREGGAMQNPLPHCKLIVPTKAEREDAWAGGDY